MEEERRGEDERLVAGERMREAQRKRETIAHHNTTQPGLRKGLENYRGS